MLEPKPLCDFCLEVACAAQPNALRSLLEPDQTHCYRLYSDSATAVLPSIGALVPGHLLVCPVAHLPATASLGTDSYDALHRVAARYQAVLRHAYGHPVASFEHGPGRLSAAGSCADHAHLHLLPLERPDLLRGATDLAWERLPGRPDPSDLAPHLDSYGYVLLEDGLGWWLADGRNVKSQQMRRAAADLLGREEEWDWAVFPQVENISATIALLRDPTLMVRAS